MSVWLMRPGKAPFSKYSVRETKCFWLLDKFISMRLPWRMESLGSMESMTLRPVTDSARMASLMFSTSRWPSVYGYFSNDEKSRTFAPPPEMTMFCSC